MRLFVRTVLVFILFYFGGSTVSGQTANFSEDYISGCAPLVVHFTNTSTGATSYSWNLGNGVITPLTNPSTSYLTAGTYTVTLTAYSGSSSSTHTVVITVYPTPTVSFSADDTTVCMGTPVTFTSTTSSGVAGPLTYSWNFGDGSSSSAVTPTHTFPAPGYYNITLSATNSQGCVSSLIKLAYIHVLAPPVASFTASTTYICNPPGAITFTNTSSGTAPFTCTWYFGDGTSGAGSPSSHTYTTDGTYTVKLIVTDANGCKDSVTMPSYIYVGSVAASFSGPATACVNSSVTFANTSTTHTASSWTFGDGGTSTSDAGTHTYTTPGTYTVTLEVWNGPCSSTVTHTITILPGPIASFTVSPTCPGAPATFTGTVPPGSSVVWLYGDGGTGSGTTSAHTYGACGTFSVKMIVTNSSGCKDTITEPYTYYNLQISINHDSTAAGCVPLTVHFHCETWTDCPGPLAPYPYAITSYTWNFGDGSSLLSGGVTTTHTYTAVGVYTAWVYITTANGCVDTAHMTVLVGTPPVANFTAIPTTICYGLPDTFLNTSTGATNYEWYFGDGGTSALTNPTYTYTEPGVFTVMLIAYDNGCPDTMIRTLYLTVDSPQAIIRDRYLCIPDNAMTFGDSSLGDNTHLWIFGDGTTSTADTLTHIFPALTTYTVSLTTYNTASGCRDTDRVIVDLSRPVITFVASDTTICRDQWVFITPTVTGGPGIAGYYWYRNGTMRDDTSAVYLDTFHVTGLYTIRLIIQDAHLCFDTLTKTNYIHVAKPVASFTDIPPSGCVPLIVNFTDNSTDLAGVPLTTFAWTYGDGGGTTVGVLTVAHDYTVAGTFAVTEIVTDGYGCKDTATGTVNAYKPVAAFNAVPTFPCVGATVNFNNTSTGAVSSSWQFGDGGTSTTTSPAHIYTATGTYTVRLIVTDAHGCSDTARYVNYITVTQPVAAFSESDSFSICLPLSEVFTNLSTGAIAYEWLFGDGNSSTSVSPSDLYITSGNFIVMLIATNAYGCKDTATRHVIVYGYAGAFSYTPDTGCAPLLVNFTSTVSNVSSITWDFGDGTTSSASSTEDTVHLYTLPGAYVPKLILSDNTGCQNSSLGDTIKIDGVTTGFKTGPTCLGDTTNFFDTSGSYWSAITGVLWSFGSTTSTLSDPGYLYTSVGTYTVTLKATDGWGCTATVNEVVTINPPPVIGVSADTTICTGDQATLTGYGAVSYTWAPPATLSCTACNPTMASPSVPTVYTVAGTDQYGCVGFNTVNVFLKTQTVSVAHGDTAVCFGTKVVISDSGATKFTWSPPYGLSSSTVSDPIADPTVTTTYTVTAQLGSCAPDVNYVTIIVYPLPTVDAGKDQTLIAGSTAQLNATGSNITTYAWTPENTLSCVTCADPVASMSVTTTYIVDVTSMHDCKNEDSVTIHLYCSSSQLFIPNSFTPNGDGQNDVFYPRGTGISKIRSFRIYNRWGELMFERLNLEINDASNAWDGTFGGGSPRPDVYVYVVEATCETGEPILIKGDVTIIR